MAAMSFFPVVLRREHAAPARDSFGKRPLYYYPAPSKQQATNTMPNNLLAWMIFFCQYD
jgi:asparagine synthetase B (glutamine-hydrolysing)